MSGTKSPALSRIDELLEMIEAFPSATGTGTVTMSDEKLPDLEVFDEAYFPQVPFGHTEFSWKSHIDGVPHRISQHSRTEVGVHYTSEPLEVRPQVCEKPVAKKQSKKERKPQTGAKKGKGKAAAKAKETSASKATKSDAPHSTERRDSIIAMEKESQLKWDSARSFEVEVDTSKPKYMVTFPYPYMNGYLHLGHAFTITKAEFAAGYQRLRGKQVLFPFGFHCTGMPIAACAQRIAEEIEQFGNPPKFPEPVEEKKSAASGGGKKKKKKAKTAKKKSGKKYQWQIMAEFGLSDAEIAEFADAKQWLRYFPEQGLKHLRRFGLKVDWRRSFITTDANPVYDSFIAWQFNTLQKQGRIKFGNRPCVFSPKERQPCADHDRSDGEGVQPQQYTMVKLEVLSEETPFTKKNGDKLAPLFAAGKRVFLVAATLRPETMYGQTNCFVLPRGKYIGVEVQTEDMCEAQVYICSEHSAENMAFQSFFKGERGAVPKVLDVEGWDLLGRALKAPYAAYEKIYTLPLTTIKMGKGTGIVTSVPSDAPSDFAALTDAKKDEAFAKKYYLEAYMIEPFDVVQIIHIDKFDSNQSAVDLCIARGVRSQRDEEKLEAIKDEVYKAGYAHGVMIVGKYKGRRVKEAKDLCAADLCAEGRAHAYWEPESLVRSRTGAKCVVAFTDQYFLTYGEESWKRTVAAHIEDTLQTFNPIAKEKFRYTVGWLHEWACSRQFGLGTHLPWDKQWVIESLSDSTIYMAFYTVCHWLQQSLDGSRGIGPVTAQQMDDGFWDAVFLKGPMPGRLSPEAKELVSRMRGSFEYWYPMDLRVSGKDLINNHLTMSLYNHAAFWSAEQMPRAFFTNGHVQLDGEKMSKSAGNFLTLAQAIEEYSADAVRYTCADAGDNLEDANFSKAVANAAILRLTHMASWMREATDSWHLFRQSEERNEMDALFENAINEAIAKTEAAYESMRFRDALANGYTILEKSKNYYLTHCPNGANSALLKRYIEVQLLLLSPICTHFCEHMWAELGFGGLVVDAKWPVGASVDSQLSHKFQFLKDTSHAFRQEYHNKEKQRKKKLAKAKKGTTLPLEVQCAANRATVCISDDYKAFQKQTLQALLQLYEADTNSLTDGWRKEVMSLPWVSGGAKKLKQKVLAFASWVVSDVVPQRGERAFDLKLPFDEFEFAKRNEKLLFHELNIEGVDFLRESDPRTSEFLRERTFPGKPTLQFRYQPDTA